LKRVALGLLMTEQELDKVEKMLKNTLKKTLK